MAKKEKPSVKGTVWVGVECGYHQEYPTVTTFNSEDQKDTEFVIKRWLKRPALKLPDTPNHRRKKYHARVDPSLLKEDNSIIAQKIIDQNERK